MKKLLSILLLIIIPTISIYSQENPYTSKVDTIYLPFKNPFRKKAKVQKAAEPVKVYPQSYYYNKAGEYLKKSAAAQGFAIGLVAAGGLSSALMADSEKKIWAVPIAFGIGAIACEIYSITLKDKAGRMLILGAGVDGAKISLSF